MANRSSTIEFIAQPYTSNKALSLFMYTIC